MAEALAAGQRALELQPWHRPAVMLVAHLLQMLDRDAETLQLLRDASQQIENGMLLAQLSLLEIELGRHADAQRSLERGIPFTLTTSDAANAHLQAVVGYDERRGTILGGRAGRPCGEPLALAPPIR